MKHIAIMNPKWQMLKKVENGEKTIESRWYSRRFAPWGNIEIGDTIYFKGNYKVISLKAEVSEVKQIDNLTPEIVKQILNEYHQQLGIDSVQIEHYYQMFKEKKYCILIYIANPKHIKPFILNRAGLGYMTSWICFRSLKDIKLN